MSIRARRLDKGWSQEELARYAGLSTRTIQRIEAGQNAGFESLKCLAAVFETSINTIVQEQSMAEHSVSKDTEVKNLLKVEREAIEFAQSILRSPHSNPKDPLTKIERDAMSYAKKLLGKFGGV
ncbi:XRE family transcriptional regulator [Alteromonas sediminis]|uniref:XRE family transcriptional regulator n=1 Tax=Alteromonas sediminis TaxID=2259342 RepID=A0A3N5Y255_9ALTE|nr:helix-turn-helix transcriptional regulator [Alteromonas sediminis]RPJ67897.1 XRE family transcriptional regulator [Alteromonas sediminis]